MITVLERFSYSPSETEGIWHVGPHQLPTLERPWVPGPDLGGLPFKSCVPDGQYELRAYTRKNGDDAFKLVNPELGVFATEPEMREAGGGRYDILAHSANFMHQLVGCIAPGMARILMMNNVTQSMERSIGSSREAIRIMRAMLSPNETHVVVIRPHLGAGGVK